MSFRIEAIHAFVAVGEDDEEGIIGMNMGGSWMPFIAADLTRLEGLRPSAEAIAATTGRQVRLVRFTTRQDLEVIG
jgi:hypothetical protein